ncbi:MAG TPA: FHA domain-containing protein [Gammaproteobacteria bacterium]|nr:FHA domain-containing protein [Gammaproteobacteria bacterium]
MIELHVQDGSGNTDKHYLSAGKHSLGKSADADIVLLDPFASKFHAELIVSNEGIYVQDLKSTNGTWVDGSKINKNHPLLHNESFNIGNLSLRAIIKNPGGDVSTTQEHQHKGNQSNIFPLPGRDNDNELFKFRKKVHMLVLEHLDLYKRATMHSMSSKELRQEAMNSAREVIKRNNLEIPKVKSEEVIIAEVVAEAIGLGPLEPLLADDSITEIMVNGPNDIYIEKLGKIIKSDAYFNSSESLMSIIERIVTPLGRRIDEGSPMVDARLEDGSRVNAIIPPLSLIGPVVTIRKFPKYRFSIHDLIKMESLTKEMADFLEVCVKNKKNVVVSGGTGSGKTTTLNILSNFIPTNERIVTIEDAAELQLNQEHVITLESRPSNVEGKGHVSIRDLVKNSLRMRPDRIVIGECRGGEAIDMLQAMNTGHDGSLTTGHANSPRDFLSRLEVMVLMSGIELPVRAIREQITSAVDIIIQQTRFSDGKRRITNIVEVDGMEGDVVLLQKIFEFKRTGKTADGNILGEYIGCGYAPTFYKELEDAGVEIDRSIFGEKEFLNEQKPSWEKQ